MAEEPAIVVGAISTEAEEEEPAALNDWMEAHGLPRGVLASDSADPVSGEQRAVFDLAWPEGIQQELSAPVAVLLNEGLETVAVANKDGFRCFTLPGISKITSRKKSWSAKVGASPRR